MLKLEVTINKNTMLKEFMVELKKKRGQGECKNSRRKS